MPEFETLVGIPTLNGPGRLDMCLRAVMANTPLAQMRAAVLVCDDGSRPDLLEGNKAVAASHGVPMLMNQQRLGVAESWNRLTRHGAVNWGAKWAALINDDVEVQEDWLEALVFSVRENSHAGMVGLNSWQGVNSGNFRPPRRLDYNEATMCRGHGMLSSCGYCFAFSVEKFNVVGGFDPRYFCFYEELDFSVALLKKGWPSYMLAYPAVIHQGGATTSEPANLDAQARLPESRAKFQAKWGSVEDLRGSIAGRKWPECVSWNTTLKRLTV